MKKIINFLYFVFLILLVFILTGCQNSEINSNETVTNEIPVESESVETVSNADVQELLMKVMKNEEKFIGVDFESPTGEETYLKDIAMYGENSEIDKYAFVDMNQDGVPEVFTETKAHGGYCIVFHYEDGKVYGYLFPIRGMQCVKTDGTYYGTGGAYTYGFNRIEFNKTEYTSTDLASRNWDEYIIDGKPVSKEAFEEFEKNQNAKEDAQLQIFINDAIIAEILDFSNSDEVVYLNSDQGDSYSEYTYVLLTLKKDGTITEDYTYPGATGHGAMLIGTYQYKDNQIIANFEKSSNPETPDEFYDINQTKTYEIRDGKLYNQETPYYTAEYTRKK